MGIETVRPGAEYAYTVLWSFMTHASFKLPYVFALPSPHILFFLLQLFWSMLGINAFTNPCYWVGYAALRQNDKVVGPEKLVRFIGINLAGHLTGDILFLLFIRIVVPSHVRYMVPQVGILRPDLPFGMRSFLSGMIGEAVQTFLMVFTSFALSYSLRYPPLSNAFIGSAIGSLLVLIGSAWTGCNINPAAVIAHAIVSMGPFWTLYDIQIVFMVFTAGPLIGAILAGVLARDLENVASHFEDEEERERKKSV